MLSDQVKSWKNFFVREEIQTEIHKKHLPLYPRDDIVSLVAIKNDEEIGKIKIKKRYCEKRLSLIKYKSRR
jgi:hypothetical protein